MSPAALALVVTTFPAGRERATAMGIWAVLAGLGGTVGVVAGGVLVDAVGWEWVFFVNVPVAVAVVPFVLRLVRESREEVVGRRTYDVAGAVTATSGLLALVYAVIGTDQHGWASGRTLGLIAASVALLAAFVAIESRSKAPLVPLRLFANRGVATGNVAQILNGAAFIGMFFLLALAMQGVLGMSAIETGIAFVPMGVTAIAGAMLAPMAVSRIGTRTTFAIGAGMAAVSLAWLARMDAGVSYAADVLPAILVYGFAIPFIGVPNTIAAIRDVPADRAGTASGPRERVVPDRRRDRRGRGDGAGDEPRDRPRDGRGRAARGARGRLRARVRGDGDRGRRRRSCSRSSRPRRCGSRRTRRPWRSPPSAGGGRGGCTGRERRGGGGGGGAGERFGNWG